MSSRWRDGLSEQEVAALERLDENWNGGRGYSTIADVLAATPEDGKDR